MSHKKRLEEQLSSTSKRKSLSANIDAEDYSQLENVDFSQRKDSQLDRLIQDANETRGTGSHKKKGLFKDMDIEDQFEPIYEGKKVSRKDLYTENHDESIDSDLADGIHGEEDQDDDYDKVNPPKAKAGTKAKGSKGKHAAAAQNASRKKVKLDDVNIDDILEDLDRQDEQVFKDAQKDTKELEKAKHVQNQQKLWDGLLESRVSMQNIFKYANQVPPYPAFDYFKKESPEINAAAVELQVELLDLMDLMTSVSSENFAKSGIKKGSSETSIGSKSRLKQAQKHLTQLKITRDTFQQDFEFDVEAIWNDIDTHFQEMHPGLEETINTFSQRFNLMNTSSIKSKFMNVFQTPMQQAQKMMDDYPRLIKRSQLKDKDFKVLGAFERQNEQEYEEEIYNDSEFYNQIYKEFLTNAQSQNELVDGELVVGNTQAYLKQRLLRSKVAKPNVDRRASKARKLRYEVHPKLMNFMTPVENTKLIPGRDDLIKNLFGLRKSLQSNGANELEPPIKTPKKKQKISTRAARELQENDEEEADIQII